MTLLDQIIDEAEEIAKVGLVDPNADRKTLAAELSQVLHTRIDPESNAAKLGEAAFRRAAFLNTRTR